MTNENRAKQRYMSQYASILAEYKELLEYHKCKAENIPAFLLSDMPHGSGTGDRTLSIVCCRDQIEDCLQKRLEKLNRIRLAIEQAISGLQDSRYRRLLHLKYLQCHTWEQVCVMMDVEWTWVHILHNRALTDIPVSVFQLREVSS